MTLPTWHDESQRPSPRERNLSQSSSRCHWYWVHWVRCSSAKELESLPRNPNPLSPSLQGDGVGTQFKLDPNSNPNPNLLSHSRACLLACLPAKPQFHWNLFPTTQSLTTHRMWPFLARTQCQVESEFSSGRAQVRYSIEDARRMQASRIRRVCLLHAKLGVKLLASNIYIYPELETSSSTEIYCPSLDPGSALQQEWPSSFARHDDHVSCIQQICTLPSINRVSAPEHLFLPSLGSDPSRSFPSKSRPVRSAAGLRVRRA